MYVALAGLHTWKRQILGKAEHELASRYLKDVYRLRKAVGTVRNPYIGLPEMQAAIKKAGYDPEDWRDNTKMNFAVYSQRWEEVREALLQLDVELLEAEVFWGKEAVNVLKPLRSAVNRLFSNVQLLLDDHSRAYSDDQLIYDGGEDDPFNIEVEKGIQQVVDFLSPHVRMAHTRSLTKTLFEFLRTCYGTIFK